MEKTVIEILKKLRLHDDGVVMESMQTKGMPYAKNRGVSIPELKAIAREYKPNQELAERLWQNSTRELKILALMIADADKISDNVIDEWLKNINSSELAEQACMNFLPHTEYAINKMKDWTNSQSLYIKQIGIILVARIAQLYPVFSDDKFSFFVEQMQEYMLIESIHIQRAVARAINALSQKSLALNSSILAIMKKLKDSESKSVQWILAESLWNVEYQNEIFQKKED